MAGSRKAPLLGIHKAELSFEWLPGVDVALVPQPLQDLKGSHP